VNQLSKSVVREICTLRSEGAGGGRLPPATRWALSNERPYRDHLVRAAAPNLAELEVAKRNQDSKKEPP
jgi:hypothetical protein